MKNKIINIFYYLAAFVIAEILIGFFILKIIPTFYWFLKLSWITLIFEWFVITTFLLAAAEFVYRKTSPKNIFWPCILIFCIQIFSIRHSFLLLISGISAALILYIITKANKLILQNIYKYLLSLSWICVVLLVLYNYLTSIPFSKYYSAQRFFVILLIIFLTAILRLVFILKKIVI